MIMIPYGLKFMPPLPAIHDSFGLLEMKPPLDMSVIYFPLQMWVGFFKECGPDEMLETLRWTNPPMGARPCETVFAFYLPIADTDNLVGWGSLKRDTANPAIMEVIRGIRPKHRRHGYADVMLKMLAEEAFAHRGAEMLFRTIYDSNMRHVARNLRASENGTSDWVYAGRTWYPDPSRLFVLTRETWVSGVPQITGS